MYTQKNKFKFLPAKKKSDIERVALISVHTSPILQAGQGDAGGMNVYILSVAQELDKIGIKTEIFTRATSSESPNEVIISPNIIVRNVQAGPYESLPKNDLPSILCSFSASVLRTEATFSPGYFDIIHSHYWLSGQVGLLARDRWSVPLVHTAHTLAKVKNNNIAENDMPEPASRILGEQQLINEADKLIVNTQMEADEIIKYYNGDRNKIDIVSPGANLEIYNTNNLISKEKIRNKYKLPTNSLIIGFVGRIQPLKAPDLILKAAAKHIKNNKNLHILIVGGISGENGQYNLEKLADQLDISNSVTFIPPQSQTNLAEIYKTIDLLAVPSYSESFGLVAIEAQACGTPILAANVGGLSVSVKDGKTGILLPDHNLSIWENKIGEIIDNPSILNRLSSHAKDHAKNFTWEQTAKNLIKSYQGSIDNFYSSLMLERKFKRKIQLNRSSIDKVK